MHAPTDAQPRGRPAATRPRPAPTPPMGYEVKHEAVAVLGVADLQIRSLLDRQQFSDPDGTAAALGISSATWPLFGLLWPSGLRLAELMAVRPLVPGERILELGCGLGLASLVSHRRGADITASDCHPLAGSFLLHNVLLNRLVPLPYRLGQWGTDAPAPGPDDVQGLFDLIIGSDVLYERDTDGALAAFIGLHCRRDAQVLIIDPDRSNRPAFNRRMLALGFGFCEQRLDLPALAAAADGSSPAQAAYKGRLLHFSRSSA